MKIKDLVSKISPPPVWKFPVTITLGAGYAFARDYNQSRGHYYAVKDIRQTLRTGVPQPAGLAKVQMFRA